MNIFIRPSDVKCLVDFNTTLKGRNIIALERPTLVLCCKVPLVTHLTRPTPCNSVIIWPDPHPLPSVLRNLTTVPNIHQAKRFYNSGFGPPLMTDKTFLRNRQ